MIDSATLDYAKGGGVVAVVVQDDRTGQVLMVAQADRDAVDRTIATGELHFRSRTRGLWHKGAASGNVLRVASLTADCDGDAVLARVIPAGPACHTGTRSCFADAPAGVLDALDGLIAARHATAAPRPGYTGTLLDDRNLRLKKLGEEAAELAVACADADADRAVQETADLVYHLLVALRAAGGSWSEVERVLADRRASRL